YHSSNHLYFSCSASDPVLHSFPTRRSSDLRTFGKVVGGARHAAVSPKSKWLAVHGLIGIDFFDIAAGERLYHLLAPRDAGRGRFFGSSGSDYIAYGGNGFIRRYAPELGIEIAAYR